MTAALYAGRDLNDKSASRELVNEQLWDRLVNRIIIQHDVDRPYAERIMDQTFIFLRICAEAPGTPYAPSPIVDIGWHTFILYTREYAQFCQRLAGRFIHHSPTDDGDNEGSATIADTVAALKAHGVSVDESLWFPTDGENVKPCEAHECRSFTHGR